EDIAQRRGISVPRLDPVLQLAQLKAANCGLHFRETPIRSDTLVKPAKPRCMLALMHRLPTFAVILEGPCCAPQALIDHGKSWEAVHQREHAPGFRWLHESIGTNW